MGVIASCTKRIVFSVNIGYKCLMRTVPRIDGACGAFIFRINVRAAYYHIKILLCPAYGRIDMISSGYLLDVEIKSCRLCFGRINVIRANVSFLHVNDLACILLIHDKLVCRAYCGLYGINGGSCSATIAGISGS